jgi:hypothetical protein
MQPTNPCPMEYTMTAANLALTEPPEKGADIDVLRL